MKYNREKKVGVIMVVGIIGCGASGMAAAITAAENPDNQIIVFERHARAGRKLLATGNGRCNLTNINAGVDGYHGDDVSFAQNALSKFPPEETIQWFRSLGLFTVTEASGRVYPYSDQANSVVDVLRFALDKPNILLKTGFDVSRVKRVNDGFSVENNETSVLCDKLIVACGGLAGTKLGGTMTGYKLLRSLGHSVTKLRPTLVQLKSSWRGVAALKGVRAVCHAEIFFNGVVKAQSTGELQFTDYGLSGPVIFEISRDVGYEKGNWTCALDFLPEYTMDNLRNELIKRKNSALLTEELLTGILHNRLGRVLVQATGISLNTKISQLDANDISAVCTAVKNFDVSITEPMGMDCAQVTAGGVCTCEFNPETMESILVPGLFVCGEVLDIDGDCGGYNLQWAWSSGRLAGFCAGRLNI